MVRDAFEPQDGPRMMSKAQTGLGVIACLSAPLGGLLTDTAGWRWALSVLALFGGATLLLVAARFQETLPAEAVEAEPYHASTDREQLGDDVFDGYRRSGRY